MSRNRLQRTLCLLAIITGVFLSSALDANAATLNVPHDYPTIQAGIDAAQDGDTVLVAPGTYVECLSIQSKWTITVASSAGPEATIIDADGKGAAFIIRDCACTLQGFTMKNGLGPGADAIIISDSWPKIRGNIFAANMLAGGTRIAILVYGISEPWIERNIFLNPGSIWITSSTSLTITNNLFLNNSGAAIEFIGGNCSYEVTNNTIVGNNVGISVYYPFTGSSPICKNNIFVGNNTAFEVTTSPAGSVTGHITSQNNLLYGNTVNYSGVSDQTGINGNISADPLFWAPAVNNFHLRSGSPAIGAADTSSIYLSATDLGGYPRAVNGRLDIGAYEFNPKENYILYTMTASAAAGGAITPEGAIPVSAGSSLTFTAAPDPGYQLIALIVDGATAGGPSVYPSTYTFSNIVSDHTITALFAHYLDYFGMQAGNHEEARVTYLSGVVQTQTDDISLDTTSFAQPSYVDLQVLPGISGSIWYQVYSNGLFMKQMQSSGYTFTFTPALPMIQTPLAPGAHWTASSAVKANLVSGTARIRAIVSPRVLVSVPAGHFLAWPIAYTLTVSGPGGTSTTPMTYWFAPYFGTVIGKDSKTTTRMTKFAVGGGTITTAPPVVTGIVPGSATIGSKISITGFQFGHLQGSSKLRIGNVECDQILSWTDTQIRCVVPETAPSGAVTVVTDTWTSNDSVKLLISPQITGVTPSSGKRGSVVKIMGNNLGTPPGKVKLGSVRAAVIQWGDTSISFTVPATMSYGTYAVTVFNSQGQSVLRRAFTVVK